MDSEMLKKLGVKVGILQGSVSSPYLLSIVVEFGLSMTPLWHLIYAKFLCGVVKHQKWLDI